MVEIEGDLVSHSDDTETGVFLLVQKYSIFERKSLISEEYPQCYEHFFLIMSLLISIHLILPSSSIGISKK